DSQYFIMYADVPNFTKLTYVFDVSGLRLGTSHVQVEHYNADPDTLAQAKVPHGKLSRHTWKCSGIFGGTVREYSVYVPAQYDPKGPPACVMVFQDGAAYLALRTTTVFD